MSVEGKQRVITTHKLLEMKVVMMTMPDKPTSKNQKYILTDLGKMLISK